MIASSSAKSTKRAARAKRTEVSPSSNLSLPLDRRTPLICVALIAVVFAIYYPVIHNGFLGYDDNEYITENPHVKAGLTWATVEWAFTSYSESNWHPLTWLSHALDCELFGLNPAGHHLVNVLLHAANAVLLFLLLQYATGFRWRSLMVAALFALHPINVESVAWAAERKNVLSMLFFLLALYAYVWYAREPGVRRYTAVACFFALALMTKPQAITFPFLLLLWDYWPLNRIGAPDKAGSGVRAGELFTARIKSLVWEKTPLLLLSAASAVVTMEAQKAGGALKDLSLYGPLLRIENAVISYVRYLGKALWPSKLAAMYPHPTKLFPVWQVAGAAVLLTLITVWVLRARNQRYLAVGWFWFLGSLVPMIGLIQVGTQALADRYAYLSFLGLFLMIVWLVADWAEARRISARWLAIPAVACLVALGTLTYRQVGYWHDIESFWLRTLALTQDNYMAHKGLAGLLHNQGKDEEAIAHVRAALAIRPNDLPASMLLGDYEHARGHLAAAVEPYQRVAQGAINTSIRARAYANLGFTYRQMGQPMKAKQCFEMSLQLLPGQPTIMVELGLIAERDGDAPTAVRQFSHAMKLQPTDVGFLLLAHALQEEGHADEANAMLQRAARISSNLPQAQKQAESLLSWK